MRADRLAFRSRRALAGAAVEFGEHRLVLHGGWLHIADARAHGSSGTDLARTMPQRRHCRNLRMAAACENPLCAISPLGYARSREPVGKVPPRVPRGQFPKTAPPFGA